MKTSEFFFELPEKQIAQYPAQRRGESRLMLLDRLTGKREHHMVGDLPEILCRPVFRGKDNGLPLLVFNNSKVRKARLVGTALQSGAKVEFLLLERMGNGEWGVGSRGCCSGDRNKIRKQSDITTIATQPSLSLPPSPLPSPYSLTNIFIYPGYRFKAVDALFTNFHTPESTLLMLVSAFAGRELVLESYAEAVGEGYRFFSYGDAMLII